jgi:hypothetical protein
VQVIPDFLRSPGTFIPPLTLYYVPKIHPYALFRVIHHGHAKAMSETDALRQKPRSAVTFTVKRPLKYLNTKRWSGHFGKNRAVSALITLMIRVRVSVVALENQ